MRLPCTTGTTMSGCRSKTRAIGDPSHIVQNECSARPLPFSLLTSVRAMNIYVWLLIQEENNTGSLILPQTSFYDERDAMPLLVPLLSSPSTEISLPLPPYRCKSDDTMMIIWRGGQTLLFIDRCREHYDWPCSTRH
jgi:hypothetical protein